MMQMVYGVAHLILVFDEAVVVSNDLSKGIDIVTKLLKSDEIFWKLVVELLYFLERCTSLGEVTLLLMAVASLLVENISQRHTFAQQSVLECIAKRAESKQCSLSLHACEDIVQKLRSTSIIQSSAILTSILKE
ncbi:unnamed protein product [Gongylonema pulchrum]|uniref:Uncharacterized protein n=1 Tax=Gongylonema pulchrum TaxID=637853 RepID=A0A3P7P2R1_9BILA|nr:unnamed protein product [Gongylonema pulchrum]